MPLATATAYEQLILIKINLPQTHDVDGGKYNRIKKLRGGIKDVANNE